MTWRPDAICGKNIVENQIHHKDVKVIKLLNKPTWIQSLSHCQEYTFLLYVALNFIINASRNLSESAANAMTKREIIDLP